MEAAAREDEGDGAVQALLQNDLGLRVVPGRCSKSCTPTPHPEPLAADELFRVIPSKGITHFFDKAVAYEGDLFAVGRPGRHIDRALTAIESRQHPWLVSSP